MAKERYLSRAPIVEAVFDVRAKTQAGFDAQKFLEVHGELAEAYPQKKEMTHVEFGLLQAAGKPPEQHYKDMGRVGYRFTSADNLQIAQFRVDGFTFSRLAPYTHWEQLFEEACRLWKVYERVAPLEEATRIAVRYINRLPLAANRIQDFSPFLTAPPPVPKGLNVDIDQFVSRVTVSDPASSLMAHIIQMVQPGPMEEIIPVILDIDAFEPGPFAPKADVLWPRFPALRSFKNKLFFSSLTEEAIVPFE